MTVILGRVALLLLVDGLLYPLTVVGHLGVDAILALLPTALPETGDSVHCPP